MVSRGWSGNVLERLVLADGRRLVAKRIVPGSNWIDRHTADEGREALLFSTGVLDRVPEAIDHAIVAAERDGDAWWVVMRDVSDSLLSDDRRLSRAEEPEQSWRPPTGCGRSSGASRSRISWSLRDCFAPLLTRRSPSPSGRTRPATQAVRGLLGGVRGGGRLRRRGRRAPPASRIRRLSSAELDALGTTLVHADIRDEQIGLDADRLVLLDWGLATQGHPVVDFAWSICHNAWRIDATHDALVEDFRRVRGERDDPRANELIGLAGCSCTAGSSATPPSTIPIPPSATGPARSWHGGCRGRGERSRPGRLDKENR